MRVSELRTFLSYGHPLVPHCPDKRGSSVCLDAMVDSVSKFFILLSGNGSLSLDNDKNILILIIAIFFSF